MRGEWAVGVMSRARPVLGVLHAVEAGLSMFFANAVTLMLGMLIGLSVTDQELSSMPHANWLCGLAVVVWLGFDVPYLWRVWRVAFERRRRERKPYAFEVARRQRTFPMPMRMLVVVWWLTHFAFGACLALVTHTITDVEEPGLGVPLKFLLGMSYGFAANGYLMLAVCAATRSERVRDVIWRARGLVDVVLGVLGAVIPPTLLQ